MKVHYPLGGKHFILHHYSYDERGQIVLARSEKSIESVIKHITKDNLDAKIKEYLEVEIVAPPVLFSKQTALFDLRDEINSFAWEAQANIEFLKEQGNPVPYPFGPCKEYKNRYWEEGHDKEKDEDSISYAQMETDNHFQCANCESGIALLIPKEELHAKYYPAWIEQFPRSNSSGRKTLTPSRAKIANDDEELYYASADGFGHHSSGLTLEKVEPWEESTIDGLRPTHLGEEVLFFYRKVKELDCSHLQSMLDVERKKIADEKRLSSEKQEEEDDKLRMEKIITGTLVVFQGVK